MSRTIPQRLAYVGAVFSLLLGCGSHDQLDLQAQESAPGSAGETSAARAGDQATGGQRAGSERASGGATGGHGQAGGAPPAKAPTGGAGAASPLETGGTLPSDAGAGQSGGVSAAGGRRSAPDAGHSGTGGGGVSSPGISGAAGAQGGSMSEAGSSGAGGAQGGTTSEAGSSGEGGAGAPGGSMSEAGRSGAAGTQGGAPEAGSSGAVAFGGSVSDGGRAGSGLAGRGGDSSGPVCTVETCGAHGTCAAFGSARPCQCDTGYDGDYCTQCAEGYELNAITHGCELPCDGVREIRCDGQCVDGTSAQSCGSCDHDCGDAQCMPSHGSWECTCPYTLCDGVCRNTLTDEDNCTNCGAVCPEGQQCFQGVCRTPAAEPPASGCGGEGELWCGEDTCLESPSQGYDEDEQNCGGCGIECSSEEICVAGQCQPASDRCWWPCDSSRGELCCGQGACVDYLNDPHNCGRCGMNCDEGESCVLGHCQCASPTARCGEKGQEPEHCYDLRFDNENCGACGHECDISAAERCVYGECVRGEGGCGLNCGSSELCCPGDDVEAGPPKCVEISSMSSSPERCGGCQPCPIGQLCSDGACGCSWPNASCTDSEHPETRTCVSLLTSDHCGECGFECTGGRDCIAPAAPEQQDRCGCPSGLTWCSTIESEACVDLAHDEQNCGSCGNACGAGEKCIGHRCVEQDGDCADSCSEDQACCPSDEDASSVCTDVLDNVDHCGGCATVCDPTYECSGGLCQAAGDLCSAPAVLPPAGIELDTDLSPFADDGAFPTACGANPGDTEQGVEAFYVLEAPAEGAIYDVLFFSDDDVSVSMGTADSSSEVCAASYDTCLTWDPISPTLSGSVVFMVSGPASAAFYLGVYPW
jgi:hypothetical protein